EMLARKKLVGHAHVTFATDDQTARRNLELLSAERAADADENVSLRRVGGRRALENFSRQLRLVEHLRRAQARRLYGHPLLRGRLDTHQRSSRAQHMYAFGQ